MSWVSQIVKSALEGDAVEMKVAFEKEIDERISDKMDDLYQEAADDLFAESEDLDETKVDYDTFRGKGTERWEITWKGASGRAAGGQTRTTGMVGIPAGSKESDVEAIWKKKNKNKKFVSAKKTGIVESEDLDESKHKRILPGQKYIMDVDGSQVKVIITTVGDVITAQALDKTKEKFTLDRKEVKSLIPIKEELDERRGGASKMGPDPFRSMTAGGEKDRKSAAQKGSKWRVTFKTGHKAVDVTARNTSEAIKKGIASADKQDVQGSPAYKDVKKISEEVDLDETSYEKDLDPNKKIKVTGVKGAKSRPFTKKFKNQKALDKWLDSDEAADYEIEYIMNEDFDLDEAKMSDGEVLAAAKKLGKNAKDAKTKEFAYGLVDYYNEHESFTPEQVGALQNIMKKASFQMAEK